VSGATQPPAHDIAARLFREVGGTFRAVVEATEPGLLAGTAFVDPATAPARAGQWRLLALEGARVEPGQPLIEVHGTAAEVGVAEDYILGPLGFASGIAARAAAIRDAAPQGLSIACGGWKKLPAALKPLLRAGLAAAGILPRLVEGDFVYLGKNSVIMLGGVDPAIAAARGVDHGRVAIQVKTVDEALHAARQGAGIVMVDTGVLADLGAVQEALLAHGLREQVILAFAGGVRVEDLPAVHALGAETVDMGRAILDAPLLDLRMRVTGPHQ
jgi:nicotinate-nucleotide pyrophosphorylase (carboxylating)